MAAELPFMASENFIAAMVRRGADRQECHEQLRQLSQEAAAQVKELGRENDLLERIKNNSYFAPVHSIIHELVEPKSFIGRAPEQVGLNFKFWKMVGLKIAIFDGTALFYE